MPWRHFRHEFIEIARGTFEKLHRFFILILKPWKHFWHYTWIISNSIDSSSWSWSLENTFDALLVKMHVDHLKTLSIFRRILKPWELWPLKRLVWNCTEIFWVKLNFVCLVKKSKWIRNFVRLLKKIFQPPNLNVLGFDINSKFWLCAVNHVEFSWAATPRAQ